MSHRHGPAWLAEFQRQFGAALRTPLDRATGTLQATPAAYPAPACAAIAPAASARDRLAVYNRQYWFRLFGAFQHEFPLVTALTGAWAMNGLAARFLDAHPPRQRDLARVADGFERFLEGEVGAAGLATAPGEPRIPRDALAQAAAIDQAFRAVFAAPAAAPFALTAAAGAGLAMARLRSSPAHALVDEDRALVALRQQASGAPGPRPAPLPPAPAVRQTWLVARTGRELRVEPIAPLQARLWRLLAAWPVGEALALLEREAVDVPDLAAAAQRWLADGVRLGLWTGLDEAGA